MNQTLKRILELSIPTFIVQFFILSNIGINHSCISWFGLNKVYMALLVTFSSIATEFYNKKHIFYWSLTISIILYIMIKEQWFVSDEEYIRNMIENHSIALNCSQCFNGRDPFVREMVKRIIKEKEKNIYEMQQWLDKSKY